MTGLKILVIAGPSAAGKTTVMTELMSRGLGFEFIRSATTRAPRKDAHSGEYIYLGKEEFLGRTENGDMLEHTEYGGNLYGTPKSEIERISGEGRIPLLILDLNGVEALRERFASDTCGIKMCAVYITASLAVLEARLRERLELEGDTEKARADYERRVAQNRRDLADTARLERLFDLIAENTTVEDTADKVLAVFNKIT